MSDLILFYNLGATMVSDVKCEAIWNVFLYFNVIFLFKERIILSFEEINNYVPW
jgi:hypothetical protein